MAERSATPPPPRSPSPEFPEEKDDYIRGETTDELIPIKKVTGVMFIDGSLYFYVEWENEDEGNGWQPARNFGENFLEHFHIMEFRENNKNLFKREYKKYLKEKEEFHDNSEDSDFDFDIATKVKKDPKEVAKAAKKKAEKKKAKAEKKKAEAEKKKAKAEKKKKKKSDDRKKNEKRMKMPILPKGKKWNNLARRVVREDS
ncbi:hypothetical protein L3Y34_013829 [Caenorhabditis briggsae]|uniref:Chromo domain-containing protein n=1 Tax=Caenorhabditis briggsae TaxID=6238 RepID=A0AAE9CWP9_CAEBR|nr:hypothetical protein L3Y34_013829 [Caenorhabditis briggsae]